MRIVSIQNKLKQWNRDITWSQSLTFGEGMGLKFKPHTPKLYLPFT